MPQGMKRRLPIVFPRFFPYNTEYISYRRGAEYRKGCIYDKK